MEYRVTVSQITELRDPKRRHVILVCGSESGYRRQVPIRQSNALRCRVRDGGLKGEEERLGTV